MTYTIQMSNLLTTNRWSRQSNPVKTSSTYARINQKVDKSAEGPPQCEFPAWSPAVTRILISVAVRMSLQLACIILNEIPWRKAHSHVFYSWRKTANCVSNVCGLHMGNHYVKTLSSQCAASIPTHEWRRAPQYNIARTIECRHRSTTILHESSLLVIVWWRWWLVSQLGDWWSRFTTTADWEQLQHYWQIP